MKSNESERGCKTKPIKFLQFVSFQKQDTIALFGTELGIFCPKGTKVRNNAFLWIVLGKVKTTSGNVTPCENLSIE